MKRIVHHLNFLQRLLLLPLYLLLKLWYATLRIKMDAVSQAIMRSNPQNTCVLYFWHQNLFMAPMLRRIRKNRTMYGLMSASKDGAWLEALVKLFRVSSVRGSSSWRGAFALRELEEIQRIPFSDIIITPDGPRGPCRKCKPGSLRWAIANKLEVISLKFEAHRTWQLNSWDHFKIPKPFSTIHITVAHPHFENEEQAIEALQAQL